MILAGGYFKSIGISPSLQDLYYRALLVFRRLFANIEGVFAMHLTSWRLSRRSRSQLLWPPMQLGGISMVCKLQAWAGAWLLKSTSFLLAWMFLVSSAATLASLLPLSSATSWAPTNIDLGAADYRSLQGPHFYSFVYGATSVDSSKSNHTMNIASAFSVP